MHFHGDLYEDVYMKMPEEIPNPHNKVVSCKSHFMALNRPPDSGLPN